MPLRLVVGWGEVHRRGGERLCETVGDVGAIESSLSGRGAAVIVASDLRRLLAFGTTAELERVDVAHAALVARDLHVAVGVLSNAAWRTRIGCL